MKPTPDWIAPFLQRLRKLVAEEDLGTLARLRRGLGKEPTFLLAHVGWLFAGVPGAQRTLNAATLVAALFASHHQPGGKGDLGAALHQLRLWQRDGTSTERRFAALIDSDREDLDGRLRHAVSLLRSKDIPVDWTELLKDILKWDSPRRPVQWRWSRSFWAEKPAPSPSQADANITASADSERSLA